MRCPGRRPDDGVVFAECESHYNHGLYPGMLLRHMFQYFRRHCRSNLQHYCSVFHVSPLPRKACAAGTIHSWDDRRPCFKQALARALHVVGVCASTSDEMKGP